MEDEKQWRQHGVVVGLGDHGPVKKQPGMQSRVADAGPHNTCKACRVVKAVDQDLYEIPLDMRCHKPKVILVFFSPESKLNTSF